MTITGQLDLFELIDEKPPVVIPPFTVWTSTDDYPHGTWCCGWCGSKSLTAEGSGGGGGAGPGDAPWYCWNFCGPCVAKYGHPEPHKPGYPIRIGVPA